jgi:hypothetical protein
MELCTTEKIKALLQEVASCSAAEEVSSNAVVAALSPGQHVLTGFMLACATAGAEE